MTPFAPPPAATARLTPLARALTLAVLLGASLGAQAQSNATSTIYGAVPAGASIVLRNLATGAQRVVSPDANGKFQATSMAPGRYEVQLLRGGTVESRLEVEARVGSGVEANFANAENTLQTVTVSGRSSRIDVSNTNNGISLSAKELSKLPVANDVASVVLLAPGVNKYSHSQYGNAASFGGSGASENAFYINGFPVVNLLTQVGASELPFGAIADTQILSGGYGAEFGRSTGGVVNITTKSGSNKFEFGGKFSYTPNGLRSKAKQEYYPNTGVNPETDGKPVDNPGASRTDTKVYGLYAGGALIRNTLFAFAALERTRTERETLADANGKTFLPSGFSRSNTDVNRSLLKLDYHLSDAHHFELTKILDKTTTVSTSYGYHYDTQTRDEQPSGGGTPFVNCCDAGGAPGANNTLLKYTGYLSDDWTVTALYGDSSTKHSRTPPNYDPNLAQTSSSASTRVPGLVYNSPQLVTGSLPLADSGESQKVLRLDTEYQLGKHQLRAGIDYVKVKAVVGSSSAGGRTWTYKRQADPAKKAFGMTESPLQGGGFGSQGFYVSEDIAWSIATPSSTQSARYIQDRYQATKTLLLDIGLRDEQFTNNNSHGEPFISQPHQIAPRFGAAWDYHGDGSLKLFANAGRYHVPVPSNLSSNVASPFARYSNYYTYTGVDPATGAPTGLHAISGKVSANNAFGQERDPRTITAIDLKPLYQDELSLGFERAHSPSLNYGVSALYRTLRSTNDDSCDQRPIDAWGEANGVDTSHFGFACAIINPGEANSLWLDLKGDGKLTRVDISAEAWGNPKVKRTYTALTFFAEHPLRDGWYGKLSYTWSRSTGNMEGQVDSIGGGDVGLTVSTDHHELMLNSDGYLANDHTHQIKAYGFYQLRPDVSVGANLALSSGKPRNCLGFLPESIAKDLGYGASYFFCDGKPAPRGSEGRAPWIAQLDLNAAYSPSFAKGLTLRADIFNVLNRQTPTSYYEVHDSEEAAIDKNYGRIKTRTAPRSVRLTAEYLF
ncbi:TonB-dependent receptor [Paucibacter sp. APW11]|uniref:TonB-dependent receptor n=1 Tax=Roseateles aquae TaxID=3077235 RepID=A0ABU3P933_9BURK|nr:TonB-dependent receptor [Paucibacter sp. APW11]MDT8999085.1 TonB-dependent receptor [Paucibacter sp. APW11]